MPTAGSSAKARRATLAKSNTGASLSMARLAGWPSTMAYSLMYGATSLQVKLVRPSTGCRSTLVGALTVREIVERRPESPWD